MLGLTTSADALHDLLPSEVTDRCMDLQHYKLVSRALGCSSLQCSRHGCKPYTNPQMRHVAGQGHGARPAMQPTHIECLLVS